MSEKPKLNLSEILLEHVGLVVAGALGLITVVHVWAFVGYDRTSALAALGVVDQPQLLLASVVILATTALPWFLFMASEWIPFLRMNSGRPLAFRVVAYVVILAAVLAAVMTTSALLLACLVVGYGAVWIRKRRARRRGRLSDDGKILVSPDAFEFGQGLLVSAIGALLVSQLSQPWMPKEELVLSGEDEPLVAWVIGADDQRALVLPPGERVRWVPLEDINDRQVCWSKGWWMLRPATDWAIGAKEAPICGD